MSGSINKVILIGNLGADPEIRFTQAGKKIAHLRMATSESWRDRQTGERRERTEWHRVVIFREGLSDVVEKYTRKGSKVCVEGQLRTRKWLGQDGHDNYSTEVVVEGFDGGLTLLDRKPADDASGYGDYGAAANGTQSAAASTTGSNNPVDFDDEIPF